MFTGKSGGAWLLSFTHLFSGTRKVIHREGIALVRKRLSNAPVPQTGPSDNWLSSRILKPYSIAITQAARS